MAAASVALAAGIFLLRRGTSLPAPGSAQYEDVTRAFYHGLAALEVGLLDDARQQFASATKQVPEEPASWANLGLSHLRLGELDAAAEPIGRALSLAPDNADLVLLAGRMEIARGRLDEGVAQLRRAVNLRPRALQARFALADEIERAAGPTADAEAMRLLDDLAQIAPTNPAIHVERARLAAKRRDGLKLNQVIGALEPIAVPWPERALEQFRALRMAAVAGDLQRAQLTTTFLRNVLSSVPSFIESLSAVRTPTELIAQPITAFVALEPPSAMPSPPDPGLRFDLEEIAADSIGSTLLAVPSDAEGPVRIFAADTVELRSLTGSSFRAPFPTRPVDDVGPSADSLLAIDWNNDFRTDILMAGSGGLRLLVQDEVGGFTDRTPATASTCNCYGAWAADVEMDGDLDVVAATVDNDALVMRNDGNGGWTSMSPFERLRRVRSFAWADLDQDGDPDAIFLDSEFRLHAFANRRAGDFVRLPGFPDVTTAAAVSIADLDADGAFDVVVLDRTGRIQRLSLRGGTWQLSQIAALPDAQIAPGFFRVIPADLDNNGAVDLVVAGPEESRIWLSDERHSLRLLEAAIAAVVSSASDLDDDGRIDLVAGMAGNRVVRLLNRGTRDYHWKRIRPRAQAAAGDQRINSFGVGGDIEVRSGLLVQKQPLTGGPVHLGLGDRTSIDVARIVWPNGVAQAEFGTDVDNTLVAEQRLKGSCPWIFAWDGTRMAFVTDFLWRSPLGLRINAQDTAGVVQTEDWVKISGSQLAARHGAYDIRVTAELWETHFFDHVALMVVDHPATTHVFVDERFSPAAPPALKVHAVEGARAVTGARDHRGVDVTAVVAKRDGTHLATFAKGLYQGIAEEHFVEFDPPSRATGSPRGRALLLASGWIYPTDSSINVAIGQGGRIRPMGLVLEAQTSDGRWRVVEPDLGFPAGKNKTLVIDLGNVGDARRLRLRTNLEIYWDALELATAAGVSVRATTLQAQQATLGYRGFSATTSPRGDSPELPDYDRLATRSQRWRDLIGYHTRFGEVKELIAAVDDRYVIMNAGDELALRFAELPPPADGWQRDFVLIGDGWEKDGDYNTGFSQTVLPLPSHDRPQYGAGVTSLELADDPVYQRHKEDWQKYHTRYVTPRAFGSGLRY